jgi:hypothetical protein
MRQDHLLSALISEIYDAALDPSRWHDVLASVARFVGGASATLFSKTAGRAPGLVVYEYGIEPAYQRLYLDQYIKLDPAPTTGHYTRTGAATTRRIFSEVGQPIASTDLISHAGFSKPAFIGSGRVRRALSISSAPCSITQWTARPCSGCFGTRVMVRPTRARASACS